MRIGIVIPTLNAGRSFEALLKNIEAQELSIHEKLVADTDSADNTAEIAKSYGYQVERIERAAFNHGGTRQFCVDQLKNRIDLVIFMTQDVILHDVQALKNLVSAFSDGNVGAAYGRQLPHQGASLLAAQARMFNYPGTGSVKSFEDRAKWGIKTAFLSDSFAAYRVEALEVVGGFPRHVIVSEDMYVGASLLKHGYKIAYVADAAVRHSHEYTLLQEMRRYFDIGVFQSREKWIRASFGAAEGEGIRLVLDQLRYLMKQKAVMEIPRALLANAAKFTGYRLGMIERYLPAVLKRGLSGQPYYFK